MDTDSIISTHSMPPRIPIAVPVSVHFVLVSLVLVDSGWLPAVYEFSHLCCFIVALWAIHMNEQMQTLVMLLVLLLFTILTDIIVLGLYFPNEQAANGDGDNTQARTWQFSAAMCIINLLLKPISVTLIVYSIFVQGGFAFSRLRDLYSKPQGEQNQRREEGSISGSQLHYQSEEYQHP